MNPRRLAGLVLPWLLIVTAGGLAAWLRIDLIEPPALAHQCSGGGPVWCPLRTLAVQAFVYYAYGYVALLAAVLALCRSRVSIAWLAAALGMIALVLYCPTGGALALLTGCLRLLRLQAG